MTLPALALREEARPRLQLEQRARRRGRPRKLSAELRHLVCEWVEAGIDADAMRVALDWLGHPVSRRTVFRLRGACLFEPLPIRYICDECGARSSGPICPKGHQINPQC